MIPSWSWKGGKGKRAARTKRAPSENGQPDAPSSTALGQDGTCVVPDAVLETPVQRSSPGAFAVPGIGQEGMTDVEIGAPSLNESLEENDESQREEEFEDEEIAAVVPEATLVDDWVVDAHPIQDTSTAPPQDTSIEEKESVKRFQGKKWWVVATLVLVAVAGLVGILAGAGILNEDPSQPTISSVQLSEVPTKQPSSSPTLLPSVVPSTEPTFVMPSIAPTQLPTVAPSFSPTTASPTQSPTLEFDPAQDAAIFSSTDPAFVATLGRPEGQTDIGPVQLAAIRVIAATIRPQVQTTDLELFTRETVRLWNEQGYDAIIIHSNGLPKAQGYDYTTVLTVLQFGFLEKKFELFVSNRTHPMIAENKGDGGFINWAFRGSSWVRWDGIVQFVPSDNWDPETMGRQFVNRPRSNFPGWFF